MYLAHLLHTLPRERRSTAPPRNPPEGGFGDAVLRVPSASDAGEGLLDDVETLVQEVLADDQRGQEAEDVAVGATGQDQQALLVAGLGERAGRLRVRLLGGRVLDQLDRDHGAAAADLGDDLDLPGHGAEAGL